MQFIINGFFISATPFNPNGHNATQTRGWVIRNAARRASRVARGMVQASLSGSGDAVFALEALRLRQDVARALFRRLALRAQHGPQLLDARGFV